MTRFEGGLSEPAGEYHQAMPVQMPNRRRHVVYTERLEEKHCTSAPCGFEGLGELRANPNQLLTDNANSIFTDRIRLISPILMSTRCHQGEIDQQILE
jgi:hypothetical protein